MREALPDEAAGGVVLEAEELLGVGLLEIRGRIEGELLKDEFLHRVAHGRLHGGPVRIELRRRVGGGIVAFMFIRAGFRDGGRGVAEIFVPGREEVHQAQAVGEVLRVLHEAPAVGHESVGLRAGPGDGVQGVHFVQTRGLRVEVRGAGKLRQLLPGVAEREGGGLDFRREGLEADLGGTSGGRAVRVDRGLDGHDAAGGQWLAAVVVGEQHCLLHRRGNLRLAAEHVDDRLLEERARTAVRDKLLGVARKFVDSVRE